MKNITNYLKDIIRSTSIIIISIVFSLGILITFAAISWPNSTPAGETSGGTFISYFNKMLVDTNISTTDGSVKNADKVDGLHANEIMAAGGTSNSSSPTCYYVSANGGALGDCGIGFNKMPGNYYPILGLNHNICCSNNGNDNGYTTQKAQYAFSKNGNHYIITPSGCSDSSTPTCLGEDFVTKTYSDAVKYCENLVFDGYSDWTIADLSFAYGDGNSFLSFGFKANSTYFTYNNGYPLLYYNNSSYFNSGIEKKDSQIGYFRCMQKL